MAGDRRERMNRSGGGPPQTGTQSKQGIEDEALLDTEPPVPSAGLIE
jgi:hypothetical protein